MEKLVISIPEPVSYIINKLNRAGYEAYAVGGCVRDSILGRTPQDWDVTTSALPAQVKEIFHKTIDTGIKHGTVTVLLFEGGFEVTTYRIDGIYEDSRHPSEVTFTSNLREDLRRRDFTINAMAYHPDEGLIDPFNGMDDLKEKVIRAVGVPDERFEEDALRIMRALRFSAQLGFAIDPETLLSVKKFAQSLRLISRERIRDELLKLISSPYPETFRLAYETGITAVILPQFDVLMNTPQNNPHHIYNVGDHTLSVMENIPADKKLRLAALLHDMGKPETRSTDENGVDHFLDHHIKGAEFAEKWMREMRFDNNMIKDVSTLILYHDFLFSKDESGVRHAINKVGSLFPDLLLLLRADTLAKSADYTERRMKKIDHIEDLYLKIKERGDCTDIKHLAVTGADLIAAGVKPGPEMGRILEEMLEEVLCDPAANTKEYLLGRL